jgi:hypothetical protein
LAEYLSYPKAKQDELKDVGGFVAGTLKDNKRKAQPLELQLRPQTTFSLFLKMILF